MRHENKKIARIVDELMTFFLCKDTNEVDFKIKKEIDRTIIKVVDYNTHFGDEFVDRFEEVLSVQRQCEVEEYYWQLAGENDCDEEFLLVGAMVDEAIVRKQDGNLYIELVRYHKNECV